MNRDGQKISYSGYCIWLISKRSGFYLICSYSSLLVTLTQSTSQNCCEEILCILVPEQRWDIDTSACLCARKGTNKAIKISRPFSYTLKLLFLEDSYDESTHCCWMGKSMGDCKIGWETDTEHWKWKSHKYNSSSAEFSSSEAVTTSQNFISLGIHLRYLGSKLLPFASVSFR